jgi:hypothetical protein
VPARFTAMTPTLGPVDSANPAEAITGAVGAALFVDSATVLVAQPAQSQWGAALCRLQPPFSWLSLHRVLVRAGRGDRAARRRRAVLNIVSNHGTPTDPAAQWDVFCVHRRPLTRTGHVDTAW